MMEEEEQEQAEMETENETDGVKITKKYDHLVHREEIQEIILFSSVINII
jgi:hypothetical protein